MIENELYEAFIILFILFPFGYFYLKTIFKALDRTVPRPRPKSAIDLEAESVEEEITLEAKRRVEMTEKLVRYSVKEPEKFTSLLANWLVNGGK